MKSRYQRMTSGACSSGQSVGPPIMLLMGWSLNRKEVTTPKFPPPPRTAQKRSSFSSSLAVTKLPSARTTSTEMRLSMVKPHLRVRWPRPPPRVRPPTPVVEMMPLGVARPKAWVAWSTSPQVAPPSTRTVRYSGSTRMPFIRERSMTRPSSHTLRPAPLCPPPRMATSRSFSRPKLTAEITSATSAQRAIRAGRLSIMAL